MFFIPYFYPFYFFASNILKQALMPCIFHIFFETIFIFLFDFDLHNQNADYFLNTHCKFHLRTRDGGFSSLSLLSGLDNVRVSYILLAIVYIVY